MSEEKVKKPMRISLCVPDLPPDEVGGTEIFTDDLVKRLADSGEIVTVFTTGSNPVFSKKNLLIERCQKRFSSPVLYNLQALRYFIRKILSSKPDLVIGHMLTSAGIAAVISATLLRKPSVVRLSGAELRFPFLLKLFLVYPVLFLADGVICINTEMERWVKKYSKNTTTLGQGISEKLFIDNKIDPLEKIETQKRFTVLFVGRLVDFKNIDLFIDIIENCPQYDFVILGDGPDAHKIHQKNFPHLTFKGLVSQEEVFKEMQRSDVLLNTSFKEPFGRIFIEAMGFSLPAIAHNAGGPADIIIPGKNGELVNSLNSSDFVLALSKIVDNKESYVKGCKEEIQKYYWSNLLPKYKDFYKKTIGIR